jgi:hypothetical protein
MENRQESADVKKGERNNNIPTTRAVNGERNTRIRAPKGNRKVPSLYA